MGVVHRVGTLAEINAQFPNWAHGTPIEFRPARAFLVNVPAAKAMAIGEEANVPAPAAGEILALWRKCPHLGCMIPPACENRGRFQCYCHQSTYNILGEKLQLGPAPRGMDRFPVRIDDGVVTSTPARSSRARRRARSRSSIRTHRTWAAAERRSQMTVSSRIGSLRSMRS